MPRKITIQDVRQDPVIRKHVIGLILCGAALVLDVALSLSPMFWYYRYDVIPIDSSNTDTSGLGRSYSGFGINDVDDFINKVADRYGGSNTIVGEGSRRSIRTKSVGLWQACTKDYTTDITDIITYCWSHNEDPFFFLGGKQLAKSIGVTQLFQCLGLLFLIVAVITSMMKLFFIWENNVLIPLGAAHAFWGAVSFIGSAGVFGVGLKNESTSSMDLTENLHFSFAFAVISGVVALAGAVVLLIAARSDKAQT